MSVMEDLISFDVIETQKENIQSLPQGRSAKALAAQFGPTPFSPVPTPGATRTLNDAIRQEYEVELQGIADADDPLDIYDRYVKWTMNAYPSAQATPESQLRQLLERATKTFQGSAQYKNDVRYLKMWLSYIRFFSDAPRETYAYLSRHGIGEGLALYYEEFSAWLEGAGRWSQAGEVYKLGIEKEARPAERLLRKFGEFQRRSEMRAQDPDEPTSPALPTVRPALAAKLDPFAPATPADPQSRRGLASSASSKAGRPKMAIFSDAEGSSGSRPGSGASSKGWDSIGTVSERKKENVMEARPWVGETLKTGKKAAGPKMMVFKDQPANQYRSIVISTKNGKSEKWFADILSVCPNEADVKEEYCFEELRARYRGWLDQAWERPKPPLMGPAAARSEEAEQNRDWTDERVGRTSDLTQTSSLVDDVTAADLTFASKKPRSRKKRLMEVKSETQTIKAVLDSPVAKAKLRRKKSSEPTMTLHTKAATDDVLDLFNQPLRNVGPIGSQIESDGDTDYDPDDYTCGVSSVGDHTRTDNVSDGGSVFNDDDTGYQSTADVVESTQPDSVSPWSEFSAGRHVPDVNTEQIESHGMSSMTSEDRLPPSRDFDHGQVHTPQDGQMADDPFTRYLPEPPEGFDMPKLPFRTAEQMAQSRLPFMTPIVEMTELSMGLSTVKQDHTCPYSKTPSRRRGEATESIPELDSPPVKTAEEHSSVQSRKNLIDKQRAFRCGNTVGFAMPVIEDAQLNPHAQSVHDVIMEAAGLSPASNYQDHRPSQFGRGAELRKFIRSLQRPSKPSLDRSTLPGPVLRFPGHEATTYAIHKELGRGAYAPVYLASVSVDDTADDTGSLVAVKSENPPSAWEFYILSTLHQRLSIVFSRAGASITTPVDFHHFADEVYLIESYHDQGTLLDLVNLVRAEPSLNMPANTSSTSPGLDECVAMFFAVELLRVVDAMHRSGILHGDLKADNCLVRLDAVDSSEWDSRYDPTGACGWSEKGLALIDFGRGIDMTAFRRDVGFLADWKTTKDDCVEMRELRPWTYQVDYWGVAGVLHVLLFGKWIEDVISGRERSSVGADGEVCFADRTIVVGKAGLQARKLKESLKRYWQTELWCDVFDLLMNPTAWTDAENGPGLPATARVREVIAALEQWLVENSERRSLKTQLKRLGDRLREKRRRD